MRQLTSPLPLTILLLLSLFSCSSDRRRTEVYLDEEGVVWLDTIPTPATLSTLAEQSDYQVAHYWDRMDFSDSVYARDPDFMRRTFARYIAYLPAADSTISYPAVTDLMQRAETDSLSYSLLAHLADDLYERGDYESYLPFAQAILESDFLSVADRMTPEYQIRMVRLNRPGTVANDFDYVTLGGDTLRMSSLRGKPLVLFFYNATCHTCHSVAARMDSSTAISTAVAEGKVNVLAIDKMGDVDAWRASVRSDMPRAWLHGYNYTQLYNTELYNISAVPTIYLLDKDGTVLLRETTPEELEQWCLTRLSR